jgi:hypothetical protein
MVSHALIGKHRRSDPFTSPTAPGITGEVTVDPGVTSATALAEASGAKEAATAATLAGVQPSSLVLTSSSSSSVPSSSSSSSASDGSGISMGAVIGACLGTLAGALVLVLAGLWLYKRSDPKKRKGPGRAGPGLQPNWKELNDDEDKWEGMHSDTKAKTRETVEIAPMEKLTMFKKSTPSVRTAYTTKTTSDELPAFNFDLHPFSQYHPNLAKELASSDDPPVAPFLHGRKDPAAVSSWDGDTIGGASSYLSTRSNRMSGTMSPTLYVARPTAAALTNSQPHYWESAEVVNIEGNVAEIGDSQDGDNPFLHPIERRKSEHNPFFGGSSSLPSTSLSKPNKSKAREITPPAPTNPFADSSEMDVGRNPTFSHSAVNSVSSVSSSDRAIQSLIAALNTTPELADTEPSLVSGSADSIYTAAEYNSDEDEEDVTNSFPLPPGSNHSGHS